jgi:hypothetical protein
MAEQILCPDCKSYYTLMVHCTLCGGTGFVPDPNTPTPQTEPEATTKRYGEVSRDQLVPNQKTKQTQKAVERSTEL